MIKHKILAKLEETYILKSDTSSDYTEEGKSLSSESLHRYTKLNLHKLDRILRSLAYNKYIEHAHLVGKGNKSFWYITDKGRDALSNHEFVWYYKLDNWHKILTVLIALLALLNSIFGFIWLGDKK